MKRALLVGVDHYPPGVDDLCGCVADAEAMYGLLKRHEDELPNFECRLLTSKPGECIVTRANLRNAIRRLFSQPADVVLFYFSGHGYLDNELGGVLVTQDVSPQEEGINMAEVIQMANKSPERIKEVVIILDCCHSGAMGKSSSAPDKVTLAMGRSILTACREDEPSVESKCSERGIFTSFVCDALAGGAADVLGQANVANLYAYVNEVFGAWESRPLFKSNISQLQVLRRCHPAVPLDVLRRLTTYFSQMDDVLPLDPSFEPNPPGPETYPRNPDNEIIFGELQKCRAARLVEPVGAEHMYDAAMQSRSCRLTKLGQFYWRLAEGNKF